MSTHTNEAAETAVTFDQLGLSPAVLRAIGEMGFEQPTEIQARAIPAVLSGGDIIGRSHTGTGKTMAFGVPAVERCLRHADCRETQVLVLCPTRELAMQACDEIRKLTRYTQAIRAVALYGGQPIQNQIPQLRRGAEIVIGTPGRIMDHIHRHTLKLDNLSMVVLDEADEMLNMGFREDIESILSYMPDGHQTLLFSATMPQAILDITDQYQHDPLMIETQSGPERTMDTIEQYYYEVPLGSKMDALALLLHTHEPKLSIIFCNTKKMVEELNRYLSEHGFHCSMLHGDMKQEARTAVMQAFKSGRTPILIATDVAARGIDVDDVDAVYNFDIPQDYEYYIHRIGRTGRAGKSGMSYTLAAGRRQVFQVRDISRFIGAPIAHKPLPCTQKGRAGCGNPRTAAKARLLRLQSAHRRADGRGLQPGKAGRKHDGAAAPARDDRCSGSGNPASGRRKAEWQPAAAPAGRLYPPALQCRTLSARRTESHRRSDCRGDPHSGQADSENLLLWRIQPRRSAEQIQKCHYPEGFRHKNRWTQGGCAPV